MEVAPKAVRLFEESVDEIGTKISKPLQKSDEVDDFIEVYRVQSVTESNIVTGGAFRRAREAGKNLVEANAERLKRMNEIFHSNPKRRIQALEDAQATGKKSPVISTTKNKDLARKNFEKLKAQGENYELLTIRGPKSAGIDFNEAFDALGGRKNPKRILMDSELEEFGILDLFIPTNKPSRSGFIITERVR